MLSPVRRFANALAPVAFRTSLVPHVGVPRCRSVTATVAVSVGLSSVANRFDGTFASSRRGFCAHTGAYAENTPSESEETRRKRLQWRAKARGWLELDVLMGTFSETHLPKYGHAEMDLLEEVLELENPDLMKWLTKTAEVPEELMQNKVMREMVEYAHNPKPGGHGRGMF